MRKHFIVIAWIVLALAGNGQVFAQNDLMNLLADKPKTNYTTATFKTTRVVLGQSIETPAAGNLIFTIQHHFGYINQGAYQFFGLDQATLRLGFAYGITNWLTLGIGRSTFEKTYDGYVKAKILRQSNGKKNWPFSMTYFANTAINTLKINDKSLNYYFSNRLTFVHQLLIARKFNSALSLQLSPTFIHRNLVPTPQDQNNVFALGAGGRIKISNHSSFNVEYYYLLPGQTANQFTNSLSIGFDIETGGHVFQLYLSNSQGILDQHFITKSQGSWLKGDIVFGFNITRTFVVKKPKEFRK